MTDASSSSENPPKWLVDHLQKHWVLVVTVATVTAFAGGLAHMHGYFSTLGFESLALSLPYENYLVIGSVTLLALCFLYAFAGLVAAAIGSMQVTRKRAKGTIRTSMLKRADGIPLAWVLLGAVFAFAPPFLHAWNWLVPVRGFMPFPLSESMTIVGLLLILVAFVAGWVVVLLRFDHSTYLAVGVAMLLLYTPTITHMVGERRADLLLEDPHHASRVVIWRHETAEPQGYVVVHQDGEVLYLVAIQGHGEGGQRIFHSTVLRFSDVARIAFLPPGVDDSYIHKKNRTEA